MRWVRIAFAIDFDVLMVDIYYLALIGVDIIETGWNLSLENVYLFNLSKYSWFNHLRKTNVWAALSPYKQTNE
jgi:hypothetical protein